MSPAAGAMLDAFGPSVGIDSFRSSSPLANLLLGHGLYWFDWHGVLHHDDITMSFLLAIPPGTGRTSRCLYGALYMANDRTCRPIL